MKRILVLSVFIFTMMTQLATADIPKTINFQGRLTDGSGVVLVDGTYPVAFRLWTHPTSIDEATYRIWNDTYDVETKGGYFSVELGSGTNTLTGLDFNATYYLDMKVGSDDYMTPRHKLNSAPYAIRADTAALADSATHATSADSATNATSAVNAANAYTLEGLAAAGYLTKNTGSVTSADVAAGAVDTQAKAPWAAGVSSDGTLMSNPIIACGTGVTDVNGELSVSLASFGFAARPWIVCTPILVAGFDPVLITIDNSSDKDHFFARSWYQPNDNRFQQKGPIYFWWIAVGAK